jgi:aryl-alcohol dehydrogenase-like predicted oxidoreductase
LTDENLEKVRKLSKVADELSISMAQLALAWILRRTEISSAITGATKVEQLKENIAASGTQLEPSVLEQIEEILGEPPSAKFKF